MLLDEKPHGVLIHAGTNDIWGRNKRNVTCERIAKDIIDIGIKCKSKGVKQIFISSVLITKVPDSNRLAKDVNDFFKLMCVEQNFIYINNDFISKEELEDQVHLSYDGRCDLVNNFIAILDG